MFIYGRKIVYTYNSHYTAFPMDSGFFLKGWDFSVFILLVCPLRKWKQTWTGCWKEEVLTRSCVKVLVSVWHEKTCKPSVALTGWMMKWVTLRLNQCGSRYYSRTGLPDLTQFPLFLFLRWSTFTWTCWWSAAKTPICPQSTHSTHSFIPNCAEAATLPSAGGQRRWTFFLKTSSWFPSTWGCTGAYL